MSIRSSLSHHLIRLSYRRISLVTNFFCLLCPLRPLCSYHVFLFSYTMLFICLTFSTVRITFFLILPDSLSAATVFKRIHFYCLQNSCSTQVMFPIKVFYLPTDAQ